MLQSGICGYRSRNYPERQNPAGWLSVCLSVCLQDLCCLTSKGLDVCCWSYCPAAFYIGFCGVTAAWGVANSGRVLHLWPYLIFNVCPGWMMLTGDPVAGAEGAWVLAFSWFAMSQVCRRACFISDTLVGPGCTLCIWHVCQEATQHGNGGELIPCNFSQLSKGQNSVFVGLPAMLIAPSVFVHPLGSSIPSGKQNWGISQCTALIPTVWLPKLGHFQGGKKEKWKYFLCNWASKSQITPTNWVWLAQDWWLCYLLSRSTSLQKMIEARGCLWLGRIYPGKPACLHTSCAGLRAVGSPLNTASWVKRCPSLLFWMFSMDK